VIALDQVFPLLAIDVPDAVKMRIGAMVDFSDHSPVGEGLVSHDRAGLCNLTR